MNKLRLILAGVLIASITLTGCGSKPASNAANTTSNQPSASATAGNKVQQTNSQTTNQSAETNNFNYEIITKTYANGNAKINYPQITNCSDSAKQNQINDLIKNDILSSYQKDVNDLVGNYYSNYKEAEAALTENTNCYIKFKSSGLLSVLYVINGSIPGSAHPSNSLHSINIDIENGTILKLKDLINIDNNFAEKFKNVKDGIWTVKVLPGIEAPAEESKELVEVIYDELKMQNDKDLISTISSDDYSFYFTEDHFGMTIYVPHAAGDYAELEIKYNDIKNNIKSDNKIWKDFIN